MITKSTQAERFHYFMMGIVAGELLSAVAMVIGAWLRLW